jgi:hypothetical protein
VQWQLAGKQRVRSYGLFARWSGVNPTDALFIFAASITCVGSSLGSGRALAADRQMQLQPEPRTSKKQTLSAF